MSSCPVSVKNWDRQLEPGTRLSEGTRGLPSDFLLKNLTLESKVLNTIKKWVWTKYFFYSQLFFLDDNITKVYYISIFQRTTFQSLEKFWQHFLILLIVILMKLPSTNHCNGSHREIIELLKCLFNFMHTIWWNNQATKIYWTKNYIDFL